MVQNGDGKGNVGGDDLPMDGRKASRGVETGSRRALTGSCNSSQAAYGRRETVGRHGQLHPDARCHSNLLTSGQPKRGVVQGTD